MEQLISRLKLAKEHALARREKNDESKRMARHEYYVRKNKRLQWSHQNKNGWGNQCYHQPKKTKIQLASDMDIPIRNKRLRTKCVKQNIQSQENRAEQKQSNSMLKRGQCVAIDIHVQVNTHQLAINTSDCQTK
jgi:hypothetical protein